VYNDGDTHFIRIGGGPLKITIVLLQLRYAANNECVYHFHP